MQFKKLCNLKKTEIVLLKSQLNGRKEVEKKLNIYSCFLLVYIFGLWIQMESVLEIGKIVVKKKKFNQIDYFVNMSQLNAQSNE